MARESTSPGNWVPVPDPVHNTRNYYDGGLSVFDVPLNVGDHGKAHRFNEETKTNELFVPVDVDSVQTLSNKRIVDSVVELEGSELRLVEENIVVGNLVFPSSANVGKRYQLQTEILTNLLEALNSAEEGSLFRKGKGTSFEVVAPVPNSVFSSDGWKEQSVTSEVLELMQKHVEKLAIELTALKHGLANSVDIKSIRSAGST